MSVCKAATRRRIQARNHYKHLGPLVRPHYSKTDAMTSAQRLARTIQREKELRARLGMRKK